MVHALIVENANPPMRHALEESFEPNGHELRAAIDPVYKRETWGRRPEDAEALKALMGNVAGDR